MASGTISRRKLATTGLSLCTAGLAGCSGDTRTDEQNSGGDTGSSVVLDVNDQQGTGRALRIAAAGAPARFYVEVRSDRETAGASDPFPADSTQTDVTIPLDPPLSRDETLRIGIRNAATEERLGLVRTIRYTLDR
jgi:hypothetical protein